MTKTNREKIDAYRAGLAPPPPEATPITRVTVTIDVETPDIGSGHVIAAEYMVRKAVQAIDWDEATGGYFKDLKIDATDGTECPQAGAAPRIPRDWRCPQCDRHRGAAGVDAFGVITCAAGHESM